MIRTIGLSVTGLTVLANLSVATAASDEIGEFATLVPETRLFTGDNGSILRCDLFFSLPGSEPVVAPKGYDIDQSVPAVVWQYSGLLPVSDYLKTVAIHSVSTEDQTRPWQQVQKYFYSGLRAEGATEADAKVAFAGAYAFAPRWTLVEFVEVEENNTIYPDSVLFDVNYIEPATKGLSVADYQALSQQILDRPDKVSLEDIRDVVNAADEGELTAEKIAALGDEKRDPVFASVPSVGVAAVSSLFVPRSVADGAQPVFNDRATDTEAEKPTATLPTTEEDAPFIGIKTSSNGMVLLGNQQPVNKIGDGLLLNTAEEEPLQDAPETIESPQSSVSEPELETVTEVAAEESVDVPVMAEVVIASNFDVQDNQTSVEDLNPAITASDEWVTLADGTIVLRDIERLVSE